MSERIAKILDAIQVGHNCAATHLESIPVREMFRGAVAWEGVVEAFELTGHPMAKRCYAWSYQDRGESQFVTVLEIPPVNSAQTAVRAAIVAQTRRSV